MAPCLTLSVSAEGVAKQFIETRNRMHLSESLIYSCPYLDEDVDYRRLAHLRIDSMERSSLHLIIANQWPLQRKMRIVALSESSSRWGLFLVSILYCERGTPNPERGA